MNSPEPIAKVRLTAPQWFIKHFDDSVVENVLFSSAVPLDRADGLIVINDPSHELLEFHGHKIWFTCEPSWHAHFKKDPVGMRATQLLDLTERAWHSNPNEAFRVPHPTHWDVTPMHNEERLSKAVAVVSNFGGRS